MSNKGYNLGGWVSKQRYRCTDLSKKERLNKIGFIWDAKSIKFNLDECCEIAIQLGITTAYGWYNAYKENKLPFGVPYDPAQYFNVRWSTITGIENVPTITKTFEECKAIAKELDIKTTSKWEQAYRENKLPKGTPYSIPGKYNRKWSDLFDKPSILSANKAKKIVDDLKISSRDEYNTMYRRGDLPEGMPSYLGHYVFKNEIGNVTEYFFSRTGRIKKSYGEAKEIATHLGIKTESAWRQAKREGKLEGFPYSPSEVYGLTNEWEGWEKFLNKQFFGKRQEKVAKDTKAILNILKDSKFHDSNVLCSLVNCSRAVLSSRIKKLKLTGLNIISSKGKGYKLIEE